MNDKETLVPIQKHEVAVTGWQSLQDVAEQDLVLRWSKANSRDKDKMMLLGFLLSAIGGAAVAAPVALLTPSNWEVDPIGVAIFVAVGVFYALLLGGAKYLKFHDSDIGGDTHVGQRLNERGKRRVMKLQAKVNQDVQWQPVVGDFHPEGRDDLFPRYRVQVQVEHGQHVIGFEKFYCREETRRWHSFFRGVTTLALEADGEEFGEAVAQVQSQIDEYQIGAEKRFWQERAEAEEAGKREQQLHQFAENVNKGLRV